MADSEEFINITDINHNRVDEEFPHENDLENVNELGEAIYQVQSNKDCSLAIIIKAGVMKEFHDILIKEFDILKFKCYLVSKLYTVEQLKELDQTCRFVMIKIMICSEKNTPVACLSYNFNTVIHRQNKKSIIDYLCDKNNKIELPGFFSITLHFTEKGNAKYINVEHFKTFHGQNEMIDEMINKLADCLLDDKIIKILDELT